MKRVGRLINYVRFHVEKKTVDSYFFATNKLFPLHHHHLDTSRNARNDLSRDPKVC